MTTVTPLQSAKTLRTVSRTLAVVVVAALVAMVLIGLAGCSDQKYAQVCIDKNTHQRVADSKCQQHAATPIFIWWYVLRSQQIPKEGSKVSGGRATLPEGEEPERNVPREGEEPETHSNSGSHGEEEGGSHSEPVEPHVAVGGER